MFTGIVEVTGRLVQVDRSMDDRRFTIGTPDGYLKDMESGGSISVCGICLTVVDILPNGCDFSADISAETLVKTSASTWEVGRLVNLEKPATLLKPMGGHLVSGHVDGIARLLSFREEARSLRLTFEAPEALARYLARKGSVTLDGVSLTVNEVDGCRFGVNIVPHTRELTSLGRLERNDVVNIEVDQIARYLERLLEVSNGVLAR